MPPTLNHISLRFLKNLQDPQILTVCMITHTKAKDLKKEATVTGMEVTSFHWDNTKNALQIVFGTEALPCLHQHPCTSLEDRSVQLILESQVDQLIFRPLSGKTRGLELESFSGGTALEKYTYEGLESLSMWVSPPA